MFTEQFQEWRCLNGQEKKVLINLCRKVGYFFAGTREYVVGISYRAWQECIMIHIYSGDTVDTLKDLSRTEDGNQ